ncbi:transcriptional regulator BolA [Acidihalobacter yilgarnensis]|uniref:DNA-binding transcriptional regulator BolA n=1 Tax=Acidihalobacter yilgarnensis TaxID=2819280 RepID=A0A1D8IT68_9GAMM|nr:BolA/IbaG family iron-sulfur metabolism protein [Acidihalobacter yilgarnensis]AOU99720.1 transcriptional regulator BolA [Acidihalobacter yilgarnensis]
MSLQQHIEQTLSRALSPEFIEVINESGNHNVPPGSESHFKVTVVSDRFVGQRLIQRHRTVNELLADELAGPLHALALHTLSPEEWFERAGQVAASPPCMGGGKS